MKATARSRAVIAPACGAVALAVVVLACAPGVGHAQGSTTWSAPYPCASDELARRTGVLVAGAPQVIPSVPMVTHGCVESPTAAAPVVWATIVAQSGHVVVQAQGTGTLCAFAQAGAAIAERCDGTAVAFDVEPGTIVITGARAPGAAGASIVDSITATNV